MCCSTMACWFRMKPPFVSSCQKSGPCAKRTLLPALDRPQSLAKSKHDGFHAAACAYADTPAAASWTCPSMTPCVSIHYLSQSIIVAGCTCKCTPLNTFAFCSSRGRPGQRRAMKDWVIKSVLSLTLKSLEADNKSEGCHKDRTWSCTILTPPNRNQMADERGNPYPYKWLDCSISVMPMPQKERGLPMPLHSLYKTVLLLFSAFSLCEKTGFPNTAKKRERKLMGTCQHCGKLCQSWQLLLQFFQTIQVKPCRAGPWSNGWSNYNLWSLVWKIWKGLKRIEKASKLQWHLMHLNAFTLSESLSMLSSGTAFNMPNI